MTVVLGAARSDGNTMQMARHFIAAVNAPVELIDLGQLHVQPFAYGDCCREDDFLAVVERLIANEHVVFATPVYWYAMSGVLKTFFDRLTDVTGHPHRKPLGRALAGVHAWLLATGTDPVLPTGFTEPFSRTAGYFAMTWREEAYARSIKGAAITPADLRGVTALANAILHDRAS